MIRFLRIEYKGADKIRLYYHLSLLHNVWETNSLRSYLLKRTLGIFDKSTCYIALECRWTTVGFDIVFWRSWHLKAHDMKDYLLYFGLHSTPPPHIADFIINVTMTTRREMNYNTILHSLPLHRRRKISSTSTRKIILWDKRFSSMWRMVSIFRSQAMMKFEVTFRTSE
jgi:hypothetical protein